MAEPQKAPTPAGEPDRKQLMRVLIPAGIIAALVIVVAVIASMTGKGGRPMSDGSDGTAEDAGLKEVSTGIKVRDLKEGDGAEVKPGAKVKVHYTGWLANGTVFDSGKDVEFGLDGVIQGWTYGIPGMKVGGIRKLVIAPDKGYGERGSPPKIPGGSTLIFEVQVVDVVTPPNVATGPGRPMSDGSNGGTEDPGLKDIGTQGLKYRDLKEGAGEPCPPGASVTIHYNGWNVMGNVFDTSKKGAGTPATFELSGLIKGWQQGIPGMKPGGVRKLVIPPDLAYGPKPRGEHIPGNATLVFEVELISFK